MLSGEMKPMTIELLPDLILGFLLLLMAWGALHPPQRRDAMTLFVAFGLVVALVWARLGAADLALAEAAIGAGLTGVLLLQAARRMPAEAANITAIRPFWFRGSLVFLVVATLMFALHILTDDTLTLAPGTAGTNFGLIDPTVPQQLSAAMPDTGVGHPVTAVLLNVRAWDTLLELVVLLLALSGLRQLYPANDSRPEGSDVFATPWPLLQSWTRFLAPLLVLTGGYLLWSGADAPGGAFQAGALLAAAAVILRLTGMLPPLRWSFWPVRTAVIAGALLFMSVAIASLLMGDGWLHYPAGQAGALIVLIEVFATLSIAVTLSLLVIGDREDLRT
jgi:multisubunit Na+/H+ antiporter MnhB subunit